VPLTAVAGALLAAGTTLLITRQQLLSLLS
jgi:hypothetical protein